MHPTTRSFQILSTVTLALSLICLSSGSALAKKGPRHRKSHAKIMAKLELSDAQKSELKAMRQSLREQKRAIKQNSSLTKQEKKAALYALRKSKQAQLSSLLTPDQQSERRTLREARQAKKRSKRLARLARKLELSPAQRTQVSDILENAAKRGRRIHSQDDLNFQEHRTQIKAHRKRTRNELQGILDAEQRATFTEMKKKRKNRRMVRGKGRKGKRQARRNR